MNKTVLYVAAGTLSEDMFTETMQDCTPLFSDKQGKMKSNITFVLDHSSVQTGGDCKKFFREKK